MERKREKLLTRMTDFIKEVADCVNSPNPSLEVHRLVHYCRIGSTFVGYLGLPFKFAQMEFLSKVNDLDKGARPDDTLETLIDREIQQNLAKKPYSSSRSLIRVKRSIVMLTVMFEQMLTKGGNSIVDAVSKSYEKSFAAYHGWATRTAVFASLPALPTRAKLMKKLHENGITLVQGCRIGSTSVGYLGLPFKFAQLEFLSKVNDLNKGARADDTLENLIDREIEQNLAKKNYSSSRSLIRVKRSIIMLSVMFEQMVTRGGNSIVGAVSKSYVKSFAAYHGWATRTAVFASLPALPTSAVH